MDDLENTIVKILREEIDREIIIEMSISRLLHEGWTLVTFGLDSDMSGIDRWMQENIKGDWRLFSGKAVMQNKEDAILFKITWSE